MNTAPGRAVKLVHIGRLPARIAVSMVLVLLIYHFADIDLTVLWAGLRDVRPGFLATALCLELVGQSLCSVRWHILMGRCGSQSSLEMVWLTYMKGLFWGVFSPSSLGADISRFMGGRRLLQDSANAATSIWLDRSIGLAALLTMALVFSILSPSATREIEANMPSSIPILFAIMSLAYLAMNLVLYFLNRVGGRFVLGHPSVAWLARENFSIFPVDRRVLQAYVLSLSYQSIEYLLVYTLAVGQCIDISFSFVAVAVAFQALLTLIPISFMSIGLRTPVYLLLFRASANGPPPAGLDNELVLLASLQTLVVMAGGIFGGLLIVLDTGRRRVFR